VGRPQTLPESLPGLWRVLRAFWPHVRQHRALVLGALLTLLAAVGLRLLEPWPLKFVFDHLLPGRHHRGPPALDGLPPMTLLGLAALALLGLTALRAAAEYAGTVGFALVGSRVLTEVRERLYRHLQRLSLSFHHGARNGDLTVRVVGDVNLLKDVTSTALLPLFANVLVLLGMAALMLWLQWRLALLVLATLPLFWLSTGGLTRRIREAARKQRAREGEMAATAAESLTAIQVVQALSLEEVFAREFAGRSQRGLKEAVRGSRLSAALERRVDVLIALATALVLFYGARLVLAGELTPGDLVVFLAYLKRSFHPLQDFAKYTGRLAKAAAAGERVLDVLGKAPEVRDLPGASPAPPLRGDVCFEGVSFAYEPGRPVLEGLDLAVPAGREVALVGPSGTGKSTLVGLLLRLYDPTGGRVLLDGRDARAYTLDSLRAQVSVVLQDTLLFAASVRDNIAFGAGGVTAEEVEAAARLANADEFIRRLPLGYDTVLGERGVTLSHGQRQRIALARAAVRRARVLILDEPTTGLDEENERAVVEGLRRLAGGRTTFLVTHDLALAARADEVLYLEHGRVLERGAHEELLRHNGRYAALYRLQAALGSPLTPEPAHALSR
jgi:ATP-binding cassette, subfamily B, bacterial